MNDKEKRDLFTQEIRTKVLGPGFMADVLLTPNVNEEILLSSPLEVYFTGVLFPRSKEDSSNASFASSDTVVTEADMGEATEDDGLDNASNDNADQSADDSKKVVASGMVGEKEDWTTKYKPCFMGLVTCVHKDTQQVELKIHYGTYSSAKITDVKVKMQGCDRKGFEAYFRELMESSDEKAKELLRQNEIGSFEQLFDIDDERGTISIKKPLVRMVEKEDENGKKTMESRPLTNLPKLDNKWEPYLIILKKLLAQSVYKRSHHDIPPFSIDVSKEGSLGATPVPCSNDLEYMTKVFVRGDKRYVKVMLRNAHTVEKTSQVKHHVFQAELKLISDSLVPYTNPQYNSNQEDNITEFIYRNEHNYGKGSGIAVDWEDNPVRPEWVRTTYMPEVAIKKFSNSKVSVRQDVQTVQDCCKLYDMSIWSALSDNKILDRLQQFVTSYQSWVDSQSTQASALPHKEASEVVNKQKALLDRLSDNVLYMRNNPEALECFKIANTAMYIQMVVARDPMFKKNREYDCFDPAANSQAKIDMKEAFASIDFFKNKKTSLTPEPSYYPFQLAFLLMNVMSTMEPSDRFRTDFVDLIWFPTGGGKTEAYLALTALTIAARRRGSKDDSETKGVAVIMRYTLRLLTAQQFERAAYLCAAMECLRCHDASLGLGGTRITTGMWIGKASTPNTLAELKQGDYKKFFDAVNPPPPPSGQKQTKPYIPSENPFPITYCPWCGCKLVSKDASGEIKYGYSRQSEMLICQNPHCRYAHPNSLPISYIDDCIYEEPPTLLFATVDKFAGLTKEEGGKLFGIGDTQLCPNLIIQDELHLINGPLGSIVGLFEAIVEQMCSAKGIIPKIIASTATTRNTESLIRNLYNRKLAVFPASGLTYDDNYFSFAEPIANSKRHHLGIMPTGHTSVETEIQLVALLLCSRVKLFGEYLKNLPTPVDINNPVDVQNAIMHATSSLLIHDLDNYWALVLYYNSLKDLGRTNSRISQEIAERVRFLKTTCMADASTLDFIMKGFDLRTVEFASRQDSSMIKELLTEAESQMELSVNGGDIQVRKGKDIALASNMISVGIDIARWNLMMIVGQPKATTEYIQSSSRAARSHDGLVVNLLNPHRNREFSVFENYTSFHNAYYKYVEPLSATPYTEMSVDKIMANILICYVLHIKQKAAASAIDKTDVDELADLLKHRCPTNDPQIKDYIDRYLDTLYDVWSSGGVNTYKDVTDKFKNANISVMKSMRSIDENIYIKF